MRKIIFKAAAVFSAVLMAAAAMSSADVVNAADKTITLRICNWEEYIDEGGWGDDELIDLDNGDIFGENHIVSDFEDWYYENYGVRVKVEYSTFGTNEELYSQLTLGDTFDLVCPSDYMIMKLMKEKALEPLSDSFYDNSDTNNYYSKGVSPYIKEVFDSNEIDGEKWSRYAAGYMWGITGMIYNPEYVDEADASTWQILANEKYFRQVTIKDNVRDAYFPTLAILNRDKLIDPEFRASADYREELARIMNDTDKDTIDKSEAKLKEIRENVYSFETDSGKADMVSGKVVANLQWSGDGVYTMDQAEEDGVYLDWAVPEECTNLWFDGWVMLKSGINGNADRKQAAEAFINFVSRPDNAVRNMYYIGYTSVIAGGDDPTVFNYLDWNYGAEDDEEDVVDYPVGYFFSGDNSDENYILSVPREQLKRQLSAQYPSEDVIERSAVMQYFDDEANVNINQMWINIRCFNLSMISARNWVIAGIVIIAAAAVVLLIKFRHRIFKKPAPKGYKRIG